MIDEFSLRFHHFGLAARNPEQAAKFVQLAGYECGPSTFDPLQNVFLQWCEKQGAPSIEIVSPASPDGPLVNILASQTTSFYHLCYEIELDIKSMVESFRAQGMRVVTVIPPTPAVIFESRRVSFHMVYGFGLIELLESTSDSHSQSGGQST